MVVYSGKFKNFPRSLYAAAATKSNEVLVPGISRDVEPCESDLGGRNNRAGRGNR